MSLKTIIAQLSATINDTSAPKAARLLALDTLEGHFETARVAVPENFAEVRAALEAQREGGVVALIKELLMDDDLEIADIVTRAHENFPGCRTTNKSVSSIARDMRKAGIDVRKRSGGGVTRAAGVEVDLDIDLSAFEDAEVDGE